MLKSCLGKFFKIVCDFNLQASVFNVRVAIRNHRIIMVSTLHQTQEPT